jgi:hypothetical protein
VIILNKPNYVEDVSGSVSHVFAYEHDLVYDENSSENLVTCYTCNICYCNKCGKEISHLALMRPLQQPDPGIC